LWSKYHQKNNKVPAQTPLLKSGVLAGTALFCVALLVDYGGEKVKDILLPTSILQTFPM